MTVEEMCEVFGEGCVCTLLDCLRGLPRLCRNEVDLRAGNALLPCDLSDQEIAAADVIFCNNYRG